MKQTTLELVWHLDPWKKKSHKLSTSKGRTRSLGNVLWLGREKGEGSSAKWLVKAWPLIVFLETNLRSNLLNSITHLAKRLEISILEKRFLNSNGYICFNIDKVMPWLMSFKHKGNTLFFYYSIENFIVE